MPSSPKITVIDIQYIGSTGTGVSNLIVKSFDSKYKCTETFISTIGGDFKSKKMTIDGITVEAKLWDTYDRIMRRGVYSTLIRPDGYVVCINTSDKKSIEFAEDAINFISSSSDNRPIILAFTKCDLEKFDDKVFQAFCQKYSKYNAFKVSAKNGTDIDKLTEEAIKNIPKFQNETNIANNPTKTYKADILNDLRRAESKVEVKGILEKKGYILNEHRKSNHFFNKAANFFTRNKLSSTSSLRKAIRIARQVGLTEDELKTITAKI